MITSGWTDNNELQVIIRLSQKAGKKNAAVSRDSVFLLYWLLFIGSLLNLTSAPTQGLE